MKVFRVDLLKWMLLLLLVGLGTPVMAEEISPPVTVSVPCAPLSPSDYPPDPTSDIEWDGDKSSVADIQGAFNHARTTENTQLGTSVPMMTLPSQAEWDAMGDGEKALWLINRERIDRGLVPLHGLESNVTSVAQTYAQYLLDNDAWGHEEDGRDPWERLNDNPAIGDCHDFLGVAENLAVFVTTGTSIPLPIEQSVYGWMYVDRIVSWGHRHAILWYPYDENGGPDDREGFLGIGRANGGPYQGPFSRSYDYAEMIVMNVFDPCANWDYGTAAVPDAPSDLAVSLTSQTAITLTWTDNSDNEDGFGIERSPDGSSGWTEVGTVGASVETYMDTDLTCETTYYYRAYAHNAEGNSDYSETTSGTTAACPASIPDAPSDLAVSLTSQTAITLTWMDNSGDENGFGIERLSEGASAWMEVGTVMTDVTTYVDTGLMSGMPYSYRVYAYNEDGNSAYSNIAQGVTQVGLAISKTVDIGGLSVVPLGGVVTYTLVIRNDGDEIARQVVMSDTLPSAVSFREWVVYKGSVILPPPATVILPSPSGATTVVWRPGDLAPGAVLALTFTVNVTNDTKEAGKTVSNVAYVSADNAPGSSAFADFIIEGEAFYYIYLPLIVKNFGTPPSVWQFID